MITVLFDVNLPLLIHSSYQFLIYGLKTQDLQCVMILGENFNRILWTIERYSGSFEWHSKVLHKLTPSHLCLLILHCAPARALRSSLGQLL